MNTVKFQKKNTPSLTTSLVSLAVLSVCACQPLAINKPINSSKVAPKLQTTQQKHLLVIDPLEPIIQTDNNELIKKQEAAQQENNHESKQPEVAIQLTQQINDTAKIIQQEQSRIESVVLLDKKQSERINKTNNDVNKTLANYIYTSKSTELTDLLKMKGLNQLITHAFRYNPSLKQTKLALEIAYNNAGITKTNQLPSVSAGLDTNRANRQERSFSAKLNASWELDIWGQVSDESLASDANVLAAKMQLQASKDALVANILKQYFTIVRDKHALEFQNRRILKYQSLESLVEKRFRLGLVSLSDLLSVKQNHQQATAKLPQLQQSLIQNERVLLNLLGVVNPRQVTQTKKILSSIGYHYPKVMLPLADLPEQNLRRRPDLQQAYFDIRNAELTADIAYKKLLPSISLSGAISTATTKPIELLAVEPAWNLLGQLTTPIFNRKKIKQQAKIAELQAGQKYWVFQQKLIDAVSNITNAQTNEKIIAQRIQDINKLIDTSEKLVKSNNRLYPLGTVSVTQLINSDIAKFDLYEQRSQLYYNQCTNRINLGLELGLGIN